MSENADASTSSFCEETSSLQRHKVVKSYGISIDSSRIHEVAFDEQPVNLRALGVNVFDQNVFEVGVLQQVDAAIALQEEVLQKEVLEKKLKSYEDELRSLEQKIKRPGLKQHGKESSLLADQEKLIEEKNQVLQRLKGLEKLKDASFRDEVAGEISKENSLSKVLHTEASEETETERLVRLGEMTPFGSVVNKHVPLVSKDFESNDDCDKNTSFDTFMNFTTNDDKTKTLVNEAVESDEDYIPDDEELKISFYDDELVFTDEDSSLGNDDGEDCSFAKDDVKKRRQSSGSNRKRLQQSVKDDGDDRMFQTRIREYKLKKDLKARGIDYEGRSDEDDEFWNDEGLDEEFDGGLKIPAMIWSKLFRYQKTAVKWLWELHCQQAGGIVGDEMGLGKTIQIISFLAGLKYSKIGRRGSRQNGLGPVLIICPATVLFQWVSEFHKWWPEFRVAVLHDTGSYKGPKDTLITRIRNEPGVLLTTYSGVRLNQEHLIPSRWDYVILDEGHIIRNPDAEVTLACKQFRTPHRLVLSGSPMQNNLRELWSLFDFVYPGKLGTLPVFMQEFSVPITMGGYSNASPVQVQTAYKCSCVLRDTINPYLLRRLKKDVKMKIDLPNKNEQVLFCRLTQEQTEIYKEYLSSREVGSILSGTMKVFPGLIMLRKICNHPDLTTEAGSLWKLRKDEEKVENMPDNPVKTDGEYGYWKRAGKLIVVQSLLKLWKKQKHKVLLFTQTRQMLKILEIFVKSQGYNYCRMDGSTSISSRQPMIEKFNKDKSVFVFLLTTRVGGLGVNLVGANRVIIYDPDWNPGTDMQARERAWRVGQKKDVTIYRLLTTGTIEEKIYHRQIFKQFLTNRVLKDPKQRRFFKSNDLFELFTLDTSDDKNSGTETGAIFAGLGCEVSVPRKPKKQHDKNNLKTLQERTKEILKTQFSNKQNKTSETHDSKATPCASSTCSAASDDSTVEVQISQEMSVDSTARDINDPVECDTLTSCNKRKKNKKDSKIIIKGIEKQTEMKKKNKKRKRNKVEGVRIGQLSHSEPYEVKKSPTDNDKLADDDYILRKLFKKSGVHSAMQHDTIVNSGNADHVLVENEAKRVATQAAEALRRSRDHCMQLRHSGLPTWTGQSGVVGSPFGVQSRTLFGPKAKASHQANATTLFSGKSLIQRKEGTDLKAGLGPPMSSTQLLARMRARNSIGGTGSEVQSSEQKYVETMTEMRNFIATGCLAPGRATTQEILSEFKSRLPANDSAIFRQMLRNICEFERGSSGEGFWVLKTDVS